MINQIYHKVGWVNVTKFKYLFTSKDGLSLDIVPRRPPSFIDVASLMILTKSLPSDKYARRVRK